MLLHTQTFQKCMPWNLEISLKRTDSEYRKNAIIVHTNLGSKLPSDFIMLTQKVLSNARNCMGETSAPDVLKWNSHHA